LSTVAHCLRAKNYINLMVGSKQPTPVWLSPEEADKVSVFDYFKANEKLTLPYYDSIVWLVRQFGNLQV
jgi:hypothetical protein